MGTGVIEAFAVAGLVVLSTTLLARAMVAERSKRLLGRLVPDRDPAAPPHSRDCDPGRACR